MTFTELNNITLFCSLACKRFKHPHQTASAVSDDHIYFESQRKEYPKPQIHHIDLMINRFKKNITNHNPSKSLAVNYWVVTGWSAALSSNSIRPN